MSLNDVIAEWIKFSKGDLITAENLLSLDRYPMSTEIICYHCQQAAEKALKAFLIANEIDPPKIHDLVKLCKMCEDFEPGFAEMAKRCEFLTKYGITMKYPHGVDVAESDAKIALKYAQGVYDKVEARLLSMKKSSEIENMLPTENTPLKPVKDRGR